MFPYIFTNVSIHVFNKIQKSVVIHGKMQLNLKINLKMSNPKGIENLKQLEKLETKIEKQETTREE